MIAIGNPRTLLHTPWWPVRNTYILNFHVCSCNNSYSLKLFITNHYNTFNRLTDSRGFVKLISTYGVFLLFFRGTNFFFYFLMDLDFFKSYYTFG